MAQIFDGKPTPMSQAFSRISWNLYGAIFQGSCPNDPLFRVVFKVGNLESGKINYHCRQTKNTINWCLSRDRSRVLLMMKLNPTKNAPVQLLAETPTQAAISRIKWHLKSDVMRGFAPDDTLFRGVFKTDSANGNGLLLSSGEIIHQWGEVTQVIYWHRKKDLTTNPPQIVFTLPMYPIDRTKKESSTRQLAPLAARAKRTLYLEKFKNYLFRNNYHFNINHLDNFMYDTFQKENLSPEQVENLWDFLESHYK